MTQEYTLTEAWQQLSTTACLVQKYIGVSFDYAYASEDPTDGNFHTITNDATQYLPTPIDGETIYFRNPHVGYTSKIKLTPLDA